LFFANPEHQLYTRISSRNYIYLGGKIVFVRNIKTIIGAVLLFSITNTLEMSQNNVTIYIGGKHLIR
ncbi:MAG: hypothetical protein ACTSXW_07255, partial [Candidatus Baldrarchaeia archaeon]